MTTDLPVSRTGATDREVEAHEHRWSTWRSVGVAFAYDGTEVGTSVVEINGDPVTPGWSRRCACGDVESNVARTAATDEQREKAAWWLALMYAGGEYAAEQRFAPGSHWIRLADELLALLAEQPGGGR